MEGHAVGHCRPAPKKKRGKREERKKEEEEKRGKKEEIIIILHRVTSIVRSTVPEGRDNGGDWADTKETYAALFKIMKSTKFLPPFSGKSRGEWGGRERREEESLLARQMINLTWPLPSRRTERKKGRKRERERGALPRNYLFLRGLLSRRGRS